MGDPDPLACAPSPHSNPKFIHSHPLYSKLFEISVPGAVEGFELPADDAEQMSLCWKAGEDAAKAILHRFLYTKSRAVQLGAVDPLADGAKEADKNPSKDSRIGKYKDARDKLDADTTSRLR